MIRRRLQKVAREFGGSYSKFEARGCKDGLSWSARYNVGSMSNGETVAIAVYTVNGVASKPFETFEAHFAAQKEN